MGEQEITEADLFSGTKQTRDAVSAILERVSRIYIHIHIYTTQ